MNRKERSEGQDAAATVSEDMRGVFLHEEG